MDYINNIINQAAIASQTQNQTSAPSQSPYSLREYAQSQGYSVDYNAANGQYSINNQALNQASLTGLQRQQNDLYGTEDQYAKILNQYNVNAGEGQYTSPYAQDFNQLYQELENYVPYETPEETKQYLSQLLQSASQPFTYDAATDTALQSAMQDVAIQGLSAAASKNTLYSGGTVANIARAQGALIPEYEAKAYDRFMDDRNREIQMASQIMEWDQMAYDRSTDQLKLIQSKFDYILQLDQLEMQKFQTLLEQRNFEKQMEISRAELDLAQKQQQIEAQWARVNQMGYVDNQASIVLGVAAGTKAQWVQQAELEKRNQLDLMAKEYQNQKDLANKQATIDKALIDYKNKLDEATALKVAQKEYEYDVALANKQQALATGQSNQTFVSGVIGKAQTLLGVKYVWGGTSTTKGMDCSGFTQYVMGQNGVSLPRTAAEQSQVGQKVAWKDLQAGDLVFWDTIEGNGKSVDHVGIYIGNGQMIHASSSQGKIVVANIDTNYWKSVFTVARRYNGTGSSGGTSSSNPTLKNGSSGSSVKQLQTQLNSYGYKLTVDGKFGSGTLSAVKDFQKKHGLTADGIVGSKTWAALGGGTSSGSSSSSGGTYPTLKNGSSGSNVKALQQKLKALGYYTGSIDGKFGSGTLSAVKAFQKKNGLSADGVVGTNTWTKLNSGGISNDSKSWNTAEYYAYLANK